MGTPFQPGEVFAGKYRVERVLGEGGMGVVVCATRVALGDQVAVKFLRAELVRSSERVSRFMREAQAAVKIRSDHVIRIIDVDTAEGGHPFIAMDLLEGEDLAQRVARGRLPVAEAVEILLQACDAVAAAHRAHVIHRDLKPANLFLTRRPNGDPVVKVLDFGISKFTEDEGLMTGVVTRTSSMLGSPTYMSPEQLRSSRDVDERTDVWSIGVIAYELIAGRPPFDFGNVPELCAAILGAPAPSLKAARPSVPAALDAVVARCLQKDPDQRYADVHQLADALRAAAPVAQTALGTTPRPVSSAPALDRPLADLDRMACAATDLADRGVPPTMPSAVAAPAEDAPLCEPHVTIELEPSVDEPHVTIDDAGDAPVSLVRLAPVAASSTGSGRSAPRPTEVSPSDAPPPAAPRVAAPRPPIVVRGGGERHHPASALALAHGPALAWPPPTHGAAMWIGFVLGALALVVALAAIVAARLGWDPRWLIP